MNITFGLSVTAGSRYFGLNQDASLVCRLPVKDKADSSSSVYHCFGVFDGHSIAGDFASASAAASFEKHLSKRISGSIVDDKVIAAVYKSVHQDLLSLYDAPPATVNYASPTANKLVKWSLRKAGQMQFYSYGGKYDRPIEFGTTALVILICDTTNECIITWSGDSRAILLSQDEEDEDFVEVTTLNELHSAKNAKEKKRIETNFPAIIHGDGYLQPKDGYYRNMQINMTRALGHRVLQNFGVIPDPQIKRIKLNRRDMYLVIATDGLWENLSDAEVRDIVIEHQTPKHAANALIERISQYDQSSNDLDNVTIIIVRIGDLVTSESSSSAALTDSSKPPAVTSTSLSKPSSKKDASDGKKESPKKKKTLLLGLVFLAKMLSGLVRILAPVSDHDILVRSPTMRIKE